MNYNHIQHRGISQMLMSERNQTQNNTYHKVPCMLSSKLSSSVKARTVVPLGGTEEPDKETGWAPGMLAILFLSLCSGLQQCA